VCGTLIEELHVHVFEREVVVAFDDNTVITLATRQPHSQRPKYNIDHDGEDIGTRADCWEARSVHGETDGDEKAVGGMT